MANLQGNSMVSRSGRRRPFSPTSTYDTLPLVWPQGLQKAVSATNRGIRRYIESSRETSNGKTARYPTITRVFQEHPMITS